MNKLLIGLLMLLPFGLLVYGTAHFAVDMPYWDAWDFVPLIQKSYDGTLTIRDLLSQHNESRPFFPRLLMIPLAQATGWNTHYELALVLLAALGIFLVLADQIVRTCRACIGRTPAWLLLITAALVFSVLQHECWTFGFTLLGYLSVFFILAGFYLLARPPFSWTRFGLAILAGIIATFSYANGLLFWGIGLFTLLIAFWEQRHWRWQPLVIWLFFLAIMPALYFINYQPHGKQPSLLESLNNSLGLLDYFCALLGSSLANIPAWPVTIPLRIGGAGLGLFVISGIGCMVLGGQRRRGMAFWLSVGGYLLLSGLLMAWGRSGLGINMALSSRYTILSGLFWITTLVLAALVMHYLSQTWTQGLKRVGVRLLVGIGWLALAAGTTSFIASSQAAWEAWADHHQALRSARDELLSFQPDPGQLLTIYPNIQKLYPRMDFLTRRRLTMFRDKEPFSAYIVVPSSSNVTLSAAGDLFPNEIFAGGYLTIRGLMPEPLHGRQAEALLVVDSNQVILARGTLGRSRPNTPWSLTLKTDKFTPGCSQVEVYALFSEKKQVVRIGGLTINVKPLSALREHVKIFMDMADRGFADAFTINPDLVCGHGWARSPGAASNQWILITDQATNLLSYTRTGDKRPDVYAAYHDPALLRCGWHVAFRTSLLTLNPSVVRAWLFLPDEQRALKLLNEFTVAIP